MIVSASRPTRYSSVVIGPYFASCPGQWQFGRHEILAPSLGLQKKAIDWRRGVIPPAFALFSVGGVTTRWSVERRISLLHRASRSPVFTTIVPGSKTQELSQPFEVARMKHDTYNRLRRLKMFGVGILYLEPTNMILKDEGESTVIYARDVGLLVPSRRTSHRGLDRGRWHASRRNEVHGKSELRSWVSTERMYGRRLVAYLKEI